MAVTEDDLTKRLKRFQNIYATELLMRKMQEKENKKALQNENPYSKEEAEKLDNDDRA
jgi:hypothetical protein